MATEGRGGRVGATLFPRQILFFVAGAPEVLIN